MKTLYVVSTPIGNLDDITIRAINTLKQVSIIACEDTRKTAILLQKLGIIDRKKLVSLFEENEKIRIPEIIGYLEEGIDIAIVSNAGTPTISDPGFKLVRECVKNKIKIVSIPGPSSVIAALSVSGLPTDKFTFLGFLPNKSTQRLKLFNSLIKSLGHISSTIIFFESPYRLNKSLEDLKSVFGDINVVVGRELTKIYEEVTIDKISLIISKFKNPRGEFIIMFNLKENG